MKTFILLLSIYAGLLLGSANAELLLQPNDRLTISGVSVGVGIYVEDYLLMIQPVAGLDIAQTSGSGQSPAGFLARLNTDVLPFKPAAALLAFDQGDASTRAKSETDVIEALKKAGVRLIVIGSPACVDPASFPNDPAKGAAENQRLAALAGIDKDVAAREGTVYADVYGTTMTAMTKAKAARGESFVLSADRDVWTMAIVSAYLQAFGCDGDIGAITIDYATGTATGSPGQSVVSFDKTRNILTLESTRYPFPFPGHFTSPTYKHDTNIQFIPFTSELNRYTLVVKNLPTAQTKVYWGDHNLDFPSAELAQGVNLSAKMSPPFNVSGADNGAVGQQQTARILDGAAMHGQPDPQAVAKQEAAFQIVKSRVAPAKSKIRVQPLAVPDPQPPGPIPIIVDTDMDGDMDDAAALALLNDFMDQGEVKLLACVHNTSNTDLSSCATIQAINAYYGHPSLPIGQAYGDKGPAKPMTSILAPAPPDGYHKMRGPFGSAYTLKIHQKFDPTFPNDDTMPAGVDVYRKALASAADGTVVICSIGTMENIQDLIQSQPDSVSPLSGLDLVRKKVRELVIMANTVPQDKYLLSKWPTRILWSTDIGNYIYPGKSLVDTPENNPVRVIFNGGQRQGWDPTAAWLAGRGTGDVYDVIAGPRPNELIATVKMPSDQVLKLFNDELARPPKR